ncbi:WD40-repeat-containing domain protein [Pseudoneurospora amorphoporcata]|uniref:WD40-repeat-containing domain protein n=1 Tax=Pseudoneurospora amorphoporcata TaxID=241081 RepID=A0AAN6SJR0_9PEZI|nr:WD40-repeat-containing domain protein [Pseudoneurospora amorphoporcata]
MANNKRKRDNAPESESVEKTEQQSTKKVKAPAPTKAARASSNSSTSATPFKVDNTSPIHIQVVAGSYDRVLHGITATVTPTTTTTSTPSKNKKKAASETTTTSYKVSFADTFLFNAHASAIRCLALSPPSVPTPGQKGGLKVLLATGATDERINIYNISAHPPSAKAADDQKLLNSITPRPVLENPKNRELGTLLHHSSNITRLVFPNRSKLLSASEDSTVAVTRVRDWALLHTFKCPIPKAQGRPSGDTAALGAVPAGVNDFAVHPSNKIMISVSKGERSMRLWNLETGKKSRVLNFPKDVLMEIGEGKHSTGEARRIVWGEDEFAVAFDRDVIVFGMDCRPRCRVMRQDVVGSRMTKVHEIKYLSLGKQEGAEEGAEEKNVLAVATEDGRILFFDTAEKELLEPPAPEEPKEGAGEHKIKLFEAKTPNAKLIAQLGGKTASVLGRIKDFTVLPIEEEETGKRSWFIASASSDGRVRMWRLESNDLLVKEDEGLKAGRQVGELLGTYETENRITCLDAFVMIPRPEGSVESEYEFDSEESEDDDDSDDE